ncbi:TerB family tellurite resistance protein [Labrys okinawensis]|uniref:TerB family tellurite resistance protein n=1 Tax=Labrys okinawensis TaxID=346911 RepID=UPI0039BC67CE
MDAIRKWAGWIAALVLVSLLLLQVPRGVFLLAIAAGVGGLYWMTRPRAKGATVNSPSSQALDPRPLNKGVDGPDPAALTRRPLHHLQDVRLAAVVLMIQLVRTGAPLTAAEKNVIHELMADPLEVEDRQAMFELAWQLTDRGRVFSPVADDLTPLLVSRLTMDERLQFIEMLTRVANAYGEASDLQQEAIVRLKRRLTMAQAANLRR